jgi:hypothetical protein
MFSEEASPLSSPGLFEHEWLAVMFTLIARATG